MKTKTKVRAGQIFRGDSWGAKGDVPTDL